MPDLSDSRTRMDGYGVFFLRAQAISCKSIDRRYQTIAKGLTEMFRSCGVPLHRTSAAKKPWIFDCAAYFLPPPTPRAPGPGPGPTARDQGSGPRPRPRPRPRAQPRTRGAHGLVLLRKCALMKLAKFSEMLHFHRKYSLEGALAAQVGPCHPC